MANGVFSSLVWKFLNGGLTQIIQLVVSIIVARMLTPSDFGAVALLFVFTSISTVFVQAGLGTAIVQKKEISQIQLSSVFCYSFLSAALLYFILYISAPIISEFYQMDVLTEYMRVLALVLIFGSFNAIQNALIARKMLWRQQCVCNMISVFSSGIIGILFAYFDWGAWAIIFQHLSFNIINCVCLFFAVRWLPSFSFSLEESRGLFIFGLNLLGANLVETVYHNLENLIIAKKFSPSILAFFTKGKMFPFILVANIDGSLQSVMLPVFSKQQDNFESLKLILRKSVSTSSFILFGVLMTLLLCADPLIMVLLGKQWMNTVPFVQLYCIIGLLVPIQTTSLQAINALGKSKVYLKIMSVKRTLGVLFLLAASFFFDNVFVLVYATLIVEIIAVIMNMYFNVKILGYSTMEFFKDIYKKVLASMAVLLSYFLYSGILTQNPYVNVVVIGLFSVTIYLMVLYVLKSEDLFYFYNRVSFFRSK